MISVCLCDPQPVVQQGFRTLLEQSADFQLVAVSATLAEAEQLASTQRPDLLIVERAFGMHPILELIGRLGDEPRPQTIIWASTISDVECFRALRGGARGIMKKTLSTEEIFDCLRAVHGGELWTETMSELRDSPLKHPRSRPLTPRERQVAELVAKGLKNREIGATLGIATGTVKIHLMHIFEKTGIRDRFELALHGLRVATEREHSESMQPAWAKN